MKTIAVIGWITRGKTSLVSKLVKFFKLNKIQVGEKLFKTKNKKHPGLKDFLNAGEYFVDSKIHKSSSYSKNLEEAHKLWNLSEEMVGQTFDL